MSGAEAPTWRTYLAVFTVLLGVALSVNAVVLAKLPGLTPIDGIVYADALRHALEGHPILEGDVLDEEAWRESLCVGQNSSDAAAPELSCQPAADVPPTMPTTAFIHPPTYFFLTAGQVRAVQAVLPDVSPFAAARIINSWWYALGGVLIVAAAVRFGARVWPATAVLAALAGTPTVVSLSSFVTPDNAVFAVSGLIALAVAAWREGRIGTPLLAASALSVGLLKQTFLLGAVAGAVLIVALAVTQRDTGWRRALLGASALLGAAAAGVVGWQIIRESLGTDLTLPPDPFAVPATPLGALHIAFRGFLLFPGDVAGPISPIPPGLAGLAAAVSAGLIAAAGGALLYRPSQDPIWAVALTGMAAVAVGGVAISALYYAVSGIFLPPAPRYVGGVLAVYLIPLLVVASRKAVWVGALAIALANGALWLALPGPAGS